MEDDKVLEEWTRTLFDADELESPSPDFTRKVMAQLQPQSTEQVRHSALIPKWLWILLGCCFAGCTFFVLDQVGIASPQIDYSQSIEGINTWVVEAASGVRLSDSLGYIFAALSAMIGFQVILLKKQLQGRMA